MGAGARHTIIDGTYKLSDTSALLSVGGVSTVRVEALSLTGNVGHNGGGLAVYGSVTAHFVEVEIHRNQAFAGGGVYATSERVFFSRCSVHHNQAEYGGGVMVAARGEVHNTTISSNQAATHGGGLYVIEGATVFIYNSTIARNRCDADDDGHGKGGGILVFNATPGADGPLLVNTIVADNSAGAGSSPDIHGIAGCDYHNLIEDTTGTTLWGAMVGIVLGVDPQLGALGRYGGPTPSHALFDGSAAIDAGYGQLSANVDQRGVSRPQGAEVDIGAFEFAGELFYDGFENGDTGAWTEG